MAMSVSRFRKTVRKFVNEELSARLKEAPFEPLFKGIDAKAFGTWVKSAYKGRVPADVAPEGVIDWISKNPAKLPITPAQITDMWRAMPAIKKGVGSMNDDDFANIEDLVANKGKYQKGDDTLKAIGSELGGMTPTGAKKIQAKGLEKIKSYFGGVEPGEETDAFGPGSAFDTAVNQAADKFTELLTAAKGDVSKALVILKKAGVPDVEDVGEAELVALQHLADLAAEGKGEQVKFLLKRDLVDPKTGDNIIKVFQNMVSKIVHPGGKRGRPPGSKNRPKK